MSSDTITIQVGIFASGCLPELLARRIREVEQHKRIAAHHYSLEQAVEIETFLEQLRECLEAISAARASCVAGD